MFLVKEYTEYTPIVYDIHEVWYKPNLCYLFSIIYRKIIFNELLIYMLEQCGSLEGMRALQFISGYNTETVNLNKFYLDP